MTAASRSKPPQSTQATHGAMLERRPITSAESAPCATAAPWEHGPATGEACRPLFLKMTSWQIRACFVLRVMPIGLRRRSIGAAPLEGSPSALRQ